jgi:hypothetical protein
MSAQRQQKVVCILGMHRSGTSAVTRIANLIGVHLGADNSLRVEPAPDNAKGHWEHKEIALINETILQRFGGSWHEPRLMPDEWEKSPVIDDLRNDARQLIEEQFSSLNLWGWKDPRTCLTLPFWQQFVSNAHYVLCLRNPVDVANSLQQRNEFPAEKSFQLWSTYVCSALKYTDGKPRLTVFFEDLIRSPSQEIKRIAEFLEQPEDVGKRDALKSLIESELQHHSSPLAGIISQSSAERSANALYLAQRICANASAADSIEQLFLQTLDTESKQTATERDSFEQNEIIQRLSAQIEEQAKVLASRLREKELELERIKNTTGFRILSRCWQIKHKYLLPLVGRSPSSR